MLINYSPLSTLLALASGATFAEAARKLRVTPSAISHQVRTLEAQLGVQLFERVGRRAELTVDAARLLEVVRAHLPPIDEALESLREDVTRVRGLVRIGGPLPFARGFLRGRVGALLQAHEELSIQLSFGVPSLLVPKLEAGSLDFALSAELVDSKLLSAQSVFVEEFWAVCSKAYLSGRVRPESADDFTRERFILFDESRPMHDAWWKSLFCKRPRPPSRVCLSVSNLDEMAHFAESGLGIAVLPNYLVASSVSAGKLVRIGPRSKRPARNSIYLLARRGAVESARLRVVREALLAKEPRG